jgi:site-specific DNA-adenine methylase
MSYYVNPPFMYAGNKFGILERLLPEFDYTKTLFIDVFAGGGAVYSNVLTKYNQVIANDTFEDLIQLQCDLINDGISVMEDTRKICAGVVSKDTFQSLLDDYKTHACSAKLWALMLCAYQGYIYIDKPKHTYRVSYCNRSDRGFNYNVYFKASSFIKKLQKYGDKIDYYSNDFTSFMELCDGNTMVYFDPPYGYVKDSRGNMSTAQISFANYNNGWKMEHEYALYCMIKEIHTRGASFVLSGIYKRDGYTSWLFYKLIQDGFYYKEIQAQSTTGKKRIESIIKNF